ncbi:MAG: P-II family nitrogen regulator, partial [Alphaproteobacteria bacterium]|nr:P-II family nitrogen regulator [Alphaproteobacteria bacterium]
MKFKLIMALVSDDKTEEVLQAARDAGATGATMISSARGEGLEPPKT